MIFFLNENCADFQHILLRKYFSVFSVIFFNSQRKGKQSDWKNSLSNCSHFAVSFIESSKNSQTHSGAGAAIFTCRSPFLVPWEEVGSNIVTTSFLRIKRLQKSFYFELTFLFMKLSYNQIIFFTHKS